MRVLVILLAFCFFPKAYSQEKKAGKPDFSPAQVLNVLRQLREVRGELNPPKLNACLKNSAGNQWSDLQAHFYCWLKADQRACFTGAVDGEFKEHPELKGDYDKAFGHCQEAKGRAYAINFDRPLARLTLEQGEVFKNLLFRQAVFAKEDQRKILEAFYSGAVPERKSFPTVVPPPAAAAIASPAVVSPTQEVKTLSLATEPNPDMGRMDDNSVPETQAPAKVYPKSCQIKTPHARTRQKPDSTSPVVAILDAAPIVVTAAPLNSVGQDTMQWYPVEFHHRGKLVSAFLAVSLVDCEKP